MRWPDAPVGGTPHEKSRAVTGADSRFLREAIEDQLKGMGYEGELSPTGTRWTLEGPRAGKPDTVVEVIDTDPTGPAPHQPTITLANGHTQLTIYPATRPAVTLAALLAALHGLDSTGRPDQLA